MNVSVPSSPNLSSRIALCLSALLAAAASVAGADVKALRFNVENIEVLKLPDVNFSAAKVLPNGDVTFLGPDRWGIHGLSRLSGTIQSFSLHAVPESTHADIQMKDDLAVDGEGRIHVPANWFEWKQASTPKAGVFVFERSGRYLATIELKMQCATERVAVDSAGNLIVLALEAASLKGLRKECFLLHKFTRKGEHLTSFSPCPEANIAGTSGSADSRNSDLARLRADVDRGHLWIRNGLVHHVLPVSRLLRVFDAEGKKVQEIALIPPASDMLLAGGGMTASSADDQVWRILSMSNGSFLVEWLHVEKAGSAGQRRGTYLALHDQHGRALSSAAHPPSRPAIPLYCDNQGRVFFLLLNRISAERMEVQLAQTSLELQ